MKEIVFNKKDYKNYKYMYHDICVKLNKDRFVDWKDNCEDFLYNGNILGEFLWYCQKDNAKYIFVNYDKKEISLQKNYDNYQYNIIIKYFEDFVKEFPNNQLEFRTER